MDYSQESIRVRIPRGKQILGRVEETLGSSRFKIACQDDKVRMCRIPGAKKRDMWVDVNDVVLIEPWDVEPDKADIVFRYTPNQARWLKNKGILKV